MNEDDEIMSNARRIAGMIRPSHELTQRERVQLDVCEAAISSSVARSTDDAAIQLMLARSYIEYLGETEEYYSREIIDRLEHIITSSLEAVARAAGIDLGDYGGEFYLPGSERSA